MTYHYQLLDVFTDERFGGNPLAVFSEADALDAPTMQRIARELNLSESAFVRRSSGAADAELRIFTPAMELPFAGHPTIGAALALVSEGAVFERRERITFAELAGEVPVALTRCGGRRTATLTVPDRPKAVPADLSPEQAAALLNLAPEELADLSTTAYSAGVPFHFIAVRSAEALSKVSLDHQRWQTQIAGSAAPHVAVITLVDWSAGRDVQLRMFAPAMGIAEDPATGAAAAALAGWLFDHQLLGDGTHHWRVHQGQYIGRASLIELAAEIADGRITAVRVGGTAVAVGRGSLDVD